MAVKTVSDTSFEAEVLASETPVVVDFWAEWCGPCKQMMPALDEIAGEMEGQISIAKVNVDENPNTPGKYGVMGLPTLMMFKNGELIAKKAGGHPKSKLIEWINDNSG